MLSRKAMKGLSALTETPEFQPPDKVFPDEEREPVYVVGAIINNIFVDVQIKDRVEVVAAALENEVFDALGKPRLDIYRFVVPSDNNVVVEFFKHKRIGQTGVYHNRKFQASLVIEGLLWGEDTNPDDLSKPIKVLKNANLLYLAEAMAGLADEVDGVMKDTGEMEMVRTKVALPSQINSGYDHPVGSKAVLIDTTAEDGSTVLVEVQAKGWQECFDIPADNVEPWSDA